MRNLLPWAMVLVCIGLVLYWVLNWDRLYHGQKSCAVEVERSIVTTRVEVCRYGPYFRPDSTVKTFLP